MLQNSPYIPIDRPDVAKECTRSKLTYKEGKDALYKFLMQSDIPFSGSERLYLTTQHKLKTKKGEDCPDVGSLPVVVTKGDLNKTEQRYNACALRQGRPDLTVSNPEYSYKLSNQNFYTVTCRLKNITSNSKPIYIVMLEDSFLSLTSRNKNRLIYLKQQHNILIFDNKDLKKIGLDISDKKWLKSLTKGVLKSWARLLFKKVAELHRIDSSFTLNDVYSAIDRRITNTNTITLVSRLKQENFNLKLSLYKELLSKKFILKEDHLPILQSLVLLNHDSVKWVESIIESVIAETRKVNVRKREYKQALTSTSGKTSVYNIEQLSTYLVKKLSKRSSLVVKVLDRGIIEITHSRTLESFVLWLSVGAKDKKHALSDDTYKVLNATSNGMLYLLQLEAKNTSTRYKNVVGYVSCLDHHNGNKSYSSSYKIPVYNGKGVYSLHIPFYKG